MSVVTVYVRAHLPNVNLLLGWACGNYIEVDKPVQAKFCTEIDVIVMLLKRGTIEHPDLDGCFLNRYSVYLTTFGVYP